MVNKRKNFKMCQVVLAFIAELCLVVNDRGLALTFIDY